MARAFRDNLLVLLVMILVWSVSETSANVLRHASRLVAEGDAGKLSKAVNHFGLNSLYKQLARDGNMAFSPCGMSWMLDMPFLGADGETASQMHETMGYSGVNLTYDEVHESFQNIRYILSTTELNTGNKPLLSKSTAFNENYITSLWKYYNAEAKNVDFAVDGSVIQNGVNDWVRLVTEENDFRLLDKVPESSTEFMFFNVIYLNRRWKRRFPGQDTKKGNFYSSGGNQTAKVDMMNLKLSSANYAVSRTLENSKLIELPYEKSTLSMIIVLPEKVNGLKHLESNLTWERLQEAIDEMRETSNVKIELPKFTVNLKRDTLKDVLSDAGMPLVFSNEANLQGIAKSPNLKLSDVSYKVVLRVNEQRTQATSGITLSGTQATSFRSNPFIIEFEDMDTNAAKEDEEISFNAFDSGSSNAFVVDHPFLFIVRETNSGIILFVGRVETIQEQ